ncbi:hypothetical protein DNU06_16805 [Putridiphycobacter roseus]|uniref:Uncharacterized protein n=1 Tax=Putridiphycobacter roseus TaxID=2219161 RepID=A0A2W1NC28_9FLAO|nr:hypothetical protein [Putridiphycobacter roseus]PZE15666.1 hypothetical protein DNU06_16805 [Putridiphycobacter roseus]
MKIFFLTLLIIIFWLFASFDIILGDLCLTFFEQLRIIAFLILTVILIIIIGLKLRKKKTILSFIKSTPVLVGICCIAVTAFFGLKEFEIFKNERQLSASDERSTLVLRKNGLYDYYDYYIGDFCHEKGTYEIINDTIFLFLEPDFNVTTYTNAKFIISKNGKELGQFDNGPEIFRYLNID